MNRATEQIIFTKEKTGWAAFCMHYPGIVSQGDTLEEAKMNIKNTFFDILAHGELENFENKKSQKSFDDPYEFIKEIYGDDFDKYVFMTVLYDLDLKDYLQIDDANKSERTNVSIKKGYKILAKMNGINISDFLNKSLSKELGVKFE